MAVDNDARALALQANTAAGISAAGGQNLSGTMGPFGLIPVAGRRPRLGVTGQSGQVKTTYRMAQILPKACYDLQFLFDNITYNNGSSELQASTPITVSASVEYPEGVITPLTWAGSTSVTIPASQFAPLTDPLSFDFPAGAVIGCRTVVSQGGSTVWPLKTLSVNASALSGDKLGGIIVTATNASPIVCSTSGNHNLTTGDTIVISGATGNTNANGTHTVTVTNATTFSLDGTTGNGTYGGSSAAFIGSDLTPVGSCTMQTSGGVFLYCPSAIYGRIGRNQTITVGIIGDSIPEGSGDTTAPGGGWVERGLGRSGTPASTPMPIINIALSGTTASQFAGSQGAIYSNSLRRRLMGLGCLYQFITFGTNDIFGSSRTLAQLQADNLAIATSCTRRGSRVLLATIFPKTTSSDSWATIANQTRTAQESVRTSYNTWVRAGCPIDPVTLAAVAVGTPGALLAGQVGHPIWKVVDPPALFEVNASNVIELNGGYWPVTGAANYATADGTHPTSAISIIASAAVPLTQMPVF